MEPNRSAPLILLVDDEESIRTMLRVTLQRHGYQVVEASNGSEAIALFQEHESTLALVLSDVIMPEMDGVELARRLAERRPSLPILFISGSCETIPKELGCHGCIRKPFTPNGIVEQIAKILTAETTGLSGASARVDN
jgi:two-component system, cell cycle sensor histidine kinase and response regulator CckA